MTYVSTDILESFAQVPSSAGNGDTDANDSIFKQLAQAASDAFDRAANVELGFFAKTSDTNTAKTVRCDGSFSLRLPPHVSGSLTSITPEDGFTFPDEYVISGEVGKQYLFVNRPVMPVGYVGDYTGYNNGWRETLPVTANYPVTGFSKEPFNLIVRAKWGFPETPSDIVQACIEYALATWRQRTDPAFAVISNVSGVADKSIPGFRETAERYRKAFGQNAVFG